MHGGWRYDADQVETLLVQRHGIRPHGTEIRVEPADVAGTLGERGGAGYDRGVLIAVKRGRAQTDHDAETWDESDVAPTLNLFDVGDARAVVAIAGQSPEDDDPLLPDGLDTNRYRLTGNGVAAPVAAWVGHRLAAMIDDIRA